LDQGAVVSWIKESLPVEGKALATAVASGIQESLLVEGKALGGAVASWIKERLLVKLLPVGLKSGCQLD